MDFRLKLGDLDLCDYPFAIEFGSDFGAPANVTQALGLLLQDGELELSSRASNRDIAFSVMIEGPDLASLADAEAALVAESEKPLNTLTIDPGDGFGVATVFTTFRAQVTLQRADALEMAAIRRYNVTLRAYPFGKSANEVISQAVTSGDTVAPPAVTQVTIENGSSATGWGANYFRYDSHGTFIDANSTSVTVVGGAELNAATPGNGAGEFKSVIGMVKGGLSVDVSTTKQLVVKWRWDQAGVAGSDWRSNSFACNINESTTAIGLTLIDGITSPARATPTTAVFKIPDNVTTITDIRFGVDLSGSTATLGAGQVESLYIDNIERNNANLASGTPRQLQRTITIQGSARTQGRIAIEHNVSSLGDVLAYFRPEDGSLYSPPLRRWRVSGPGASVDPSLVSGVYDNISGSVVSFRVPAQRVPTGRYLLMARLGGADTVCNIPWNVGTMYGSTDVGPTQTGTATINLTTAYRVFPIARVQLPTRDMDGATTADVRVEMVGNPVTGTTCRLDEAWLFNLSTGRLIQVACGTGTPAVGGPANRCFIESPTVAQPRPTVRIGTLANRADSRYAMDSAFSAWQFPELPPGDLLAFTVTSNALDAKVAAAYPPAWHTNAAS